MSHKVLTTLALLSILVALAGCGSGGPKQLDVPAGTTESVPAPTDSAPAPVVTEEEEVAEARQEPVTEECAPQDDGTTLCTDISSTSLTLDGEPCVLGVFRDITEQKQAEQVLAEPCFLRSRVFLPRGLVLISKSTAANRACFGSSEQIRLNWRRRPDAIGVNYASVSVPPLFIHISGVR